MIEGEGLAQDDNRHDGAEHRHQIDEHARPAGPDQFDPAHERELREEGRSRAPQRRAPEGRTAVGQMNPPDMISQIISGTEVTKAATAMAASMLTPRDVRALAKADRVAGIEHRGHDHHDVAAIEGERREPRRIALRGDHGHANHGDESAKRLQRA